MEGQNQEFHGFKNVEEFSQKVCKSMVAASRAFQQLPPSGSPLWDLRKSYPEFNRGLKTNRSCLINNMISLLEHVNVPPTDFRKRDVDEKFEFLVDANDEVLERIATSLDKAEGLFKRTEILVVNPGAEASTSNPPGLWKEKKLERLNNGPEPAPSSTASAPTGPTISISGRRKIFRKVKEKPQLKFSSPVDNSMTPFVPKLRYKPNSIKPLSILPEYNANNEEFYGHPYYVELNKWHPQEHMLERANPKFPDSLEDTPFLLVENCRQMEKMLLELENANEIAIDLEHHSYRSFLGITCLMQLSTRTTDYVIDTLALRDEMHNLNEIFTNPKVLKVFHGATSDIAWLQKDFSVYVVGMFDTGIAAQVLKFPQASFQYLLSELCNTSTDKSYQLADWRLRPLPQEMVQYARKDTHYLLHIYDLLKNKLLDEGNEEANLLHSVYDQSRNLCLKRYEKPTNNPQVALRKCKKPLNNRQLHGFVELFKWRDKIAREKDESLHFVLPNHMLLTIAETLPKEMTGILACCDPVPILVNQNLSVVHQIVTSARELPMHHQESSAQQQAVKKAKQKNWMIMMDSIHEIVIKESHLTLPGQEGSVVNYSEKDWWLRVDNSDVQVKSGPKIKFGGIVNTQTSVKVSSSANRITPYSRYKLTHEIIRNLSDPNKKSEMDMENPVIKSVVETIIAEPAEDKEQPQPEPSRPVRRPTAFDQDFVPFNPMSLSSDKRKGRKRKHDESNNGADEPTSPPVNIKTEEGEVVSSGDDDSKPSFSAPLHMSVKDSPKKKSKKQRKNLIKRLARRGIKRRYELEAQNSAADAAPEVMEIPVVKEEPKNISPKKKGKGGAKLTSYLSFDKGKRFSTPGQQSKNEEASHGGKNKKKKKGFFRLPSNSGGKSITFK